MVQLEVLFYSASKELSSQITYLVIFCLSALLCEYQHVGFQLMLVTACS